MKKTFLALLSISIVCGVVIYSCKKDASSSTSTHNYMNVGYITGFDTGSCSCCGGMMMTFSSNTTPYAADYKLIDTLPSDLGIGLGDTFPIKMSVDWKVNLSKSGCSNYISITKFQK